MIRVTDFCTFQIRSDLNIKQINKGDNDDDGDDDDDEDVVQDNR